MYDQYIYIFYSISNIYSSRKISFWIKKDISQHKLLTYKLKAPVDRITDSDVTLLKI